MGQTYDLGGFEVGKKMEFKCGTHFSIPTWGL